eukprot:TRINITY_DN1241_c0_g1_i3.p1 TRINITY_DN1241_c0_g1~~TRINITY_DN1241_c0_g1_i3.p1  ORF type:complete len:1128 (+),score=216.65 TRINITY_DN1241_c0_g1_i3:92-3475(+)
MRGLRSPIEVLAASCCSGKENPALHATATVAAGLWAAAWAAACASALAHRSAPGAPAQVVLLQGAGGAALLAACVAVLRSVSSLRAALLLAALHGTCTGVVGAALSGGVGLSAGFVAIAVACPTLPRLGGAMRACIALAVAAAAGLSVVAAVDHALPRTGEVPIFSQAVLCGAACLLGVCSVPGANAGSYAPGGRGTVSIDLTRLASTGTISEFDVILRRSDTLVQTEPPPDTPRARPHAQGGKPSPPAPGWAPFVLPTPAADPAALPEPPDAATSPPAGAEAAKDRSWIEDEDTDSQGASQAEPSGLPHAQQLGYELVERINTPPSVRESFDGCLGVYSKPGDGSALLGFTLSPRAVARVRAAPAVFSECLAAAYTSAVGRVGVSPKQCISIPPATIQPESMLFPLRTCSSSGPPHSCGFRVSVDGSAAWCPSTVRSELQAGLSPDGLDSQPARRTGSQTSSLWPNPLAVPECSASLVSIHRTPSVHSGPHSSVATNNTGAVSMSLASTWQGSSSQARLSASALPKSMSQRMRSSQQQNADESMSLESLRLSGAPRSLRRLRSIDVPAGSETACSMPGSARGVFSTPWARELPGTPVALRSPAMSERDGLASPDAMTRGSDRASHRESASTCSQRSRVRPQSQFPTDAPSSTHKILKTVNWKRGAVIGVGGFGKVYLGLNLDSGELMAVKNVAFDSAEKGVKAKLRLLQNEIEIMKGLDHPCIVKYFFCERNGTAVDIFMEYVPGGNLATLLQNFGAFADSTIVQYTYQILTGLAYLHGAGVVHRDIKGANCLLAVDGCVKLADFGASIIRGDGTLDPTEPEAEKTLQCFGTPYWMAPEMIVPGAQVGWQADIWSLGCTVMEMLTAKHPWAHLDISGVALLRWIAGEEDITLPEASLDCASLMEDCLERDREKRTDAKELLFHSFFFEPTEGSVTSSSGSSGDGPPRSESDYLPTTQSPGCGLGGRGGSSPSSIERQTLVVSGNCADAAVGAPAAAAARPPCRARDAPTTPPSPTTGPRLPCSRRQSLPGGAGTTAACEVAEEHKRFLEAKALDESVRITDLLRAAESDKLAQLDQLPEQGQDQELEPLQVALPTPPVVLTTLLPAHSSGSGCTSPMTSGGQLAFN